MTNDRYIVEREFEHAGYKCVVTFNVMGHRCGYVGIPKNHSLYGKEYSDYLEIKKADVGDRKISGNSNYPIESDLWWFGFDCAHCDDAKELELAYERFPNYRERLAMKIECEDRFRIDGTIVRTEEYVAEECKKLAEQLKEFEESEE